MFCFYANSHAPEVSVVVIFGRTEVTTACIYSTKEWVLLPYSKHPYRTGDRDRGRPGGRFPYFSARTPKCVCTTVTRAKGTTTITI